MTNYFIKNNINNGFNLIVPEKTAGLEFVSFAILQLKADESYSLNTKEKEMVLVLLKGNCDIMIDDKKYNNLSRKNVFEQNATALYIPRKRNITINAKHDLQLALAFAPAQNDNEIIFIPPEQVREKIVGKETYQRRVVDIVHSEYKVDRLVVGETYNQPGKWSSYPPHRHDFDNYPAEINMEEIYFFKIEPTQGFGFIRIYTDDKHIDKSYAVENGAVVILPEGYHPVAAAPGYKLYYLWILAGRQRILCPNDDPNHNWIKNL